jgi:putative addiction module component (TIGR02574 family)
MIDIDISKLTTEQKLELLDELWESLDEEVGAWPLTDAQRKEIDRRIEDMERKGTQGVPLEEALQRIQENAS